MIHPLTTDAALRAVERLARTIWHEHYPGIITRAQIDYMLERGYALPAMRRELAAGVRYDGWYDGDALVGFAAYGLEPGGADVKLHKLYVRADQRGRGAARQLVDRAVAHARTDGARAVVLNVNKRNTTAIAVYERLGFRVREAVVVDIGGGFVMDDYVMARET